MAVSAAPASGGVRVLFRRARPVEPPRRARLEWDAGTVAEVAHSPDLRSVSVLWRGGGGSLRCRFPLGGVGRYHAGDPVQADEVFYVLLDEPGATVRMVLPLACPVRPVLPLEVRVAPEALPARLEARGHGVRLERPEETVPLALPRDARGVLAVGDVECVLKTSRGDVFVFLVGVDPDGTPTATTGYVETGQHG